MKVLTVRQPWASAIFDGKPVENRTTNVFGAYRGPIAIHAGKTYVEGATIYPGTTNITEQLVDPDEVVRDLLGVIIGVVDLVDVHKGWGEYCDCDWATGWPEVTAWHGVFENPRHLPIPIEHKGTLGLRDLHFLKVARIAHQVCIGAHDDRCCAPCRHHRAGMHVGCILR